MPELRTERLLLRRWHVGDGTPFAALNADPEVIYFPRPLTREASDRLAELADAELERQGWGPWALGQPAAGGFLGFTGLARPTFEAPFTPAVEVGSRLARPAWGFGFATEAAHAAAARPPTPVLYRLTASQWRSGRRRPSRGTAWSKSASVA